MPRDFAIDPTQLIQIRDASGTSMPFSKGIMATSILATGLETAHAYGIAADIQRRLLEGGHRELSATDLAELAAGRIAESAGDRVANRYRAWRKAKRTGRPVVVCLSGAPGVGKSTLATRLALRLGINRVVPTDAIREVLRTVIPATVLPELHVSTYEPLDPEVGDGSHPFLRQARAVSAATAAVANRLVAERRSVILEGVHLLPGDIAARLEGETRAILVERLLVLEDEDLHRGHLSRRFHAEPGRSGQRPLDHLQQIRRQQDELRRLAARVEVQEHDIAHPEDLTQRIVDDVVTQAETGVSAA